MYKKGDFVSIKDGIELENGEKTNNWAGQILEKISEFNTFLIALDAPTLDALSDDYIKDCVEGGGYCERYVFEDKDLDLSLQRRDTENSRKLALNHLHVREAAFEEEDEDDYDEAIHQKWLTAYIESPFFAELPEGQKKDADFVVDTYLTYMYQYVYITPNAWDQDSVKEVCLEIVPRKVSTDDTFFENFGDILISFLKFFQEHTGIFTNKLQDCVQEIKDEIPKRAKDPRNWGMAKSMLMPAIDQGIDISEKDQLDQYMLGQSLGGVQSPFISSPSPVKNEYKHIGRNQRVSVKYEDGTIVEDVKFKKIQKDLLAGKCELLS